MYVSVMLTNLTFWTYLDLFGSVYLSFNRSSAILVTGTLVLAYNNANFTNYKYLFHI